MQFQQTETKNFKKIREYDMSGLNKLTILALALSTVFWTGCNQTTSETFESKAEQAQDQVKETAQETANDAEDASITAAVKLKLAADEQVSASRIEVDTEDGIVTLNGTAASQMVADHAAEVAKGVENVRSVRSFIKVTPDSETDKTTVGELGDDIKEGVDKTGDQIEEGAEKAGTAVKDASITSAVKLKFAADDQVKALDIDVDTKNGVVRLSGTVATDDEATRAVEIAQAVDGVKKVRSNLIVRS